MKKIRALAAAVAVLALHSAGHAGAVEDWPNRPIRMITPFPPGGAVDLAARLVGEHLTERLGQPVIIENMPGAGTAIGVMAVVRAEPDGHTLLMSGASSFTSNPATRTNLPYDPLKDLAPVAIVATGPLFVTSADSPYQSFADVVEKARSAPEAVSYYTYGPGTVPHLAGELIGQSIDASLFPVPYKGSNDAVMSLLRGDVDLGLDTALAVAPHIRSGKLRALALTGVTRSPFLPDVPTMVDLDIPEAAVEGFSALMAPANTPAPIIDRLVREVTIVMAMPDIQERLAGQYLEAVAIGPQETTERISSDLEKFGQIVKTLNLTLN